MSKIVSFVNRKEGSGKTTTVFNLAGALVEMGRPVLWNILIMAGIPPRRLVAPLSASVALQIVSDPGTVWLLIALVTYVIVTLLLLFILWRLYIREVTALRSHIEEKEETAQEALAALEEERQRLRRVLREAGLTADHPTNKPLDLEEVKVEPETRETPANMNSRIRRVTGKRDRLRAAQQVQLEALPALGEADKALLGPSRPPKERERARLRALRRRSGLRKCLMEADLQSRPITVPDTDNLRAPKPSSRQSSPAPTIEEEPEAECPAVVEAPGEMEMVTPAATILGEMPRPYREITTLTAALEDLGANKKDGFGFVLRFGSAAEDDERESEFEVTGTGLLELSKHLVKWFGKAKDIEEIPLQVVDEGSGELKIFISET